MRSCSSGSAQNGDVDGFALKPNKLFMQEAIGAEYGEGFETFRQISGMRNCKMGFFKGYVTQ